MTPERADRRAMGEPGDASGAETQQRVFGLFALHPHAARLAHESRRPEIVHVPPGALKHRPVPQPAIIFIHA